MLKELNNETAAKRHSNHAHGLICEACCFRIATPGNAFLRSLGENWYLASQACAIFIEDTAAAVGSAYARLRNKRKDHEHVSGQLCTRCITARQRNSIAAIQMCADYADTGVGLVAYTSMLIGGFVAGVAVLMMSVMPMNSKPAKPRGDSECDSDTGRPNRDRVAEFDDRKVQPHNNYGLDSAYYTKISGSRNDSGPGDGNDHQRGGYFARDARKEDESSIDSSQDGLGAYETDQEAKAFWSTYNRSITELNTIGNQPVWNVRDDLHKDDRLTKELNSMARAVEDGKEDPRKLQAAADELYRLREEKNRKDAKRDVLSSQYLDAKARAKRCLELAAIAHKNRDYKKRNQLSAEGESLWHEAKTILAAFRNV